VIGIDVGFARGSVAERLDQHVEIVTVEASVLTEFDTSKLGTGGGRAVL
jgi:hypothetical protein